MADFRGRLEGQTPQSQLQPSRHSTKCFKLQLLQCRIPLELIPGCIFGQLDMLLQHHISCKRMQNSSEGAGLTAETLDAWTWHCHKVY